MTNRFRQALAVPILATTFTATIVLIPAAQTRTLSADEKELAAYTLTMPTVRKVAAAVRAFAELQAQDPKTKELAKIKEEMKALQARDELTEADQQKLEKLQERAGVLEEEISRIAGPGNATTITEIEARIKSHPGATAILAKEGLPPREFAKCTLALLQAAMVKGFSQGKVDMAKLPPGINPANITFIEQNEKELAELQKEMQNIGKK